MRPSRGSPFGGLKLSSHCRSSPAPGIMPVWALVGSVMAREWLDAGRFPRRSTGCAARLTAQNSAMAVRLRRAVGANGVKNVRL